MKNLSTIQLPYRERRVPSHPCQARGRHTLQYFKCGSSIVLAEVAVEASIKSITQHPAANEVPVNEIYESIPVIVATGCVASLPASICEVIVVRIPSLLL